MKETDSNNYIICMTSFMDSGIIKSLNSTMGIKEVYLEEISIRLLLKTKLRCQSFYSKNN